MQLLSICNLEKGIGAAQRYIIFASLLSHESEIYSSLLQKPNKNHNNKGRFCNTMASVAVVHISIQND